MVSMRPAHKWEYDERYCLALTSNALCVAFLPTPRAAMWNIPEAALSNVASRYSAYVCYASPAS